MVCQDVSALRSQTDDVMSHHPKALQEDHLTGFRPHAHAGITLDTDGDAEAPVCSTSLLFSQLRFVYSLLFSLFLQQSAFLDFDTICLVVVRSEESC